MISLIERSFDGFVLSTDNSKVVVQTVYEFLSRESYWAQHISMETVAASIKHSLCLGVYASNGALVGFGRMITDYATFGYLADIFVLKSYRGLGISKEMMKIFCEIADECGLRRFLLTTQDAHGLYRQFGFEAFSFPERMMGRKGIVYGK